jgi:hypothetical protein
MIPAAFEKPKLYIPPVNSGVSFITQEYLMKIRHALAANTPEALGKLESYIKEMPARDVPPDISEATKIHLKEMWG